MPKADEAVVEARAAQRANSKRATLDLLNNKPRSEKEFLFEIPTADGDKEVSFLFRAIGNRDYDRLLTKYPPSIEQKADGLSFDIDKFAPDLLSRVCVDPELSFNEWSSIWNSPDWNRAETMQLYLSAVEVCSRGMKEVPPTEPG